LAVENKTFWRIVVNIIEHVIKSKNSYMR